MAPALSYQPQLRDDKLVWVTEEDGRQRILTSEPGGMWRRFNAWVSKAVGLEKML
jgi:putative cardiolipin synthase